MNRLSQLIILHNLRFKSYENRKIIPLRNREREYKKSWSHVRKFEKLQCSVKRNDTNKYSLWRRKGKKTWIVGGSSAIGIESRCFKMEEKLQDLV